jgi:hypothetical protein
MGVFRRLVLPIVIATLVIAASEFLRNQVLLIDYWVSHYAGLGLEFPMAPVNGAIWGVWSLLFAVGIYTISRRYSLLETVAISWFVGFVLMWLVVGNMNVLPFGILPFAIPLSLLETFLAALAIVKVAPPERKSWLNR